MRDGILTSIQRSILAMAAAGKSNAQIAQALQLSKRTVDTHMRNTFEALRVSDRTSAVVLAAHHGEIDLAVAAGVILAEQDDG